MGLVLITPNQVGPYSGLDRAIEPPIWAAMVAERERRAGRSVAIIDANALDLTAEQTAEVAAELNPKSLEIVVMGHNPSAASTPLMPEAEKLAYALERACPGVEKTMSGLHPAALGRDTLLCNPIQHVRIRHGDLPGTAAWDLLPMEKCRAHTWHAFGFESRSPYAAIYASLGCPFRCSFCNIHTLAPKYRAFLVEDVLAEIDLLVAKYGVKHLKIADELFVLSRKRVTEICDALIERKYGLNIVAYARVDTVSPQLLQKLKRAGINWIAYGFESAAQRVRDAVGKGTTGKQAEDAIDWTRDAGISIIANAIFGLPDDDHDTMRVTLDWLIEKNFAFVNLYSAMAYPGSALYDQTPKKDLPETWAGYGQLAYECQPLPTKHLSAREVLAFRDRAFQTYYGRPEYQDMLAKKFGTRAMLDVQAMLAIPLKRKLLETPDGHSVRAP